MSMISMFSLSPHGLQGPGLRLIQCAAAGSVPSTSGSRNWAAATAPRLAAADGGTV